MTSSDAEVLDPDPIKASYDVYIRPHPQDGNLLYILQYPTRGPNQDYTTANNCTPLEVRLKQRAGLVEIDVPLNLAGDVDQGKSIRWGTAMKMSGGGHASGAGGKGGGSYGLPGGFGIGAATVPKRGRVGEEAWVLDESLGAYTQEWEEKVEEGKVLNQITLGGQFLSKESTTPQYMIGAFYQNKLHLTPINEVVQMRPQFHHIDALDDLSKKAKAASGPGGAAGGAPQPPATRGIHMTVKSTLDGEEETTDTMAERVRATQEEPWRKLRFVDQDTDDAWQTYKEDLFVRDTDAAPRLVSALGDAEFLDAISAPRDAARVARNKRVRKGKGKGKGKRNEGTGADEGDSDDSIVSVDGTSDVEMMG